MGVVLLLDGRELRLHRHADPAALLHDGGCHGPFIEERGGLRPLLLELELQLVELGRAEFPRGGHRTLLELTLLDLELGDPLSVVELVGLDVQLVQPVVLVDRLKDGIILGEEDDLAAVLRVLDVARSLLDLTAEDYLAI